MVFAKPLFPSEGEDGGGLIGPTGSQGPTGPTSGGGTGPTGPQGPTGTPYWTLYSTNKLAPTDISNNIGIGKTGPTATLDVSGNIISNQDATINSLTIGRGSGNASTNTALGYLALQSNISGTNNVSIGYGSLKVNTTGAYNTAIGTVALYQNQSGVQNVAIGYNTLAANNADSNTAIGVNSLAQNTIGANNMANGYSCLFRNASGSNNAAYSYDSLYNNTTGNYNSAYGTFSGRTNETGSNNTYIGYQADCSGNNLSNSTALGANAKITISNQIVLGTASETTYIPGSNLQIRTSPYIIGSTNALDISGNVNIIGNTSSTSFTTTSDYRIKEDVTSIDFLPTFTVDNLRPVIYTNKISGKQDIGLIAHELQEYYPFLVKGEKDGEENQSVNYIGLIGILIKEIKELKESIKKSTF